MRSNNQTKSMVSNRRTQDVQDLILHYKEIFTSREINLLDWEQMKTEIPIEVIRKEIFQNNENFIAFEKEMNMQKLSQSNPYHGTMDEGEEKQASITDHNSVFSTNKVRIGSSKLDYEFNKIYDKHLKEMGLDENQIREVIGIIMSVQNSDEDKAREQTMKVIRRYCTQNNLPPELSNALGIQADRIFKILRTRIARNLGEAVVQQDEKKRLRSLKRGIASICDIMGVTQYEIGALLIGSDKD